MTCIAILFMCNITNIQKNIRKIQNIINFIWLIYYFYLILSQLLIIKTKIMEFLIKWFAYTINFPHNFVKGFVKGWKSC